MDPGPGLLFAISMVITEKLRKTMALDPSLTATLAVGIQQALSGVCWVIPSFFSWVRAGTNLGTGRGNLLSFGVLLLLSFALAWRLAAPLVAAARTRFDGTWSEVRLFDAKRQVKFFRYFKQEIAATMPCVGTRDEVRMQLRGMDEMHICQVKKQAQPPDGIAVPFYDARLGVSGRFTLNKHAEEFTQSKDIPSFRIDILEIVLQIRQPHPGYTAAKYLDDLEKKLAELELVEKGIEVYSFSNFVQHEVFSTTFKTSHKVLYQGPRLSPERKQVLLDTFFHPHKQDLWLSIESVHSRPEEFVMLGQTPRASYILHGPPGSGKSSFAYRVAMTLDRHLCSIDLTRLTKRSALMQLLYGTSSMEGTDVISLRAKDAVFIFDEFDSAIRAMVESQKLQQAMVLRYADSNENAPQGRVPKPASDSDRLTLEDLLEILQGPIPLDQAIIIATTNDLEYIKCTCPALVRPGRLTPVEFPNLRLTVLNDIGRRYFGQEIMPSVDESWFCRQFGEGICISEVLSLATEIRMRRPPLSPEDQVNSFRERFMQRYSR
ncbi:MAG: AAA family ATPase [Sulfobacillus sp.]